MKYGVIYADCPWSFAVYSNKGKGRSADAHYKTMTLDDIKSYPVQEYAADHSVLLLWVTDPMLSYGMEVIKAWGFAYKTVAFYWCKTKNNAIAPWQSSDFPIGTGYWSRANPEQCLLATRGYPRRRFADVRKLIITPRREHSRKPDEIYERIERLCSGPYLELFARNRHPGWDAIGDEVEKGIQGRRWHSDAREFYEPEADDA
jgi:N6-adenosine-specific RNA methylase IME4